MEFPFENVIRICLAFGAGALLGFERESQSKPAGLRTMILITVGSALFSVLSISLTNSTFDRIASNIVTGVGFVGGGVIFKEGASVKGITTAATIWTAAAIGMAIGFGDYWLAGVSLVLVMITLTTLSYIEEKVDGNEKKIYKITFDTRHYSLEKLEEDLLKIKVRFSKKKLIRKQTNLTVYCHVKEKKSKHKMLENELMTNGLIEEFEV